MVPTWHAAADEVVDLLSSDNYPIDACLTCMLFVYQNCTGTKLPAFSVFAAYVFQRLAERFLVRCEEGMSTWPTREPLFWVRCAPTDHGAQFCPTEKVWRRRRTDRDELRTGKVSP